MPKKQQTYIVLDVETTGLDVTKEKMIEFAAVKLVNGKIKDRYETLINPEQHIRHSSFLVHNISQEMVEDAPKIDEVMPKILEFIGDYPIVGHNVIFDYSFINEASKALYDRIIPNKTFDSQAMFREVFPDEISHGLGALMEKFGVSADIRHRAMADTEALAKCFPKLLKLYEQRFNWQLSQCDKVPYLFERYLRIQNAIHVMQSELLDLKSVFKVYFEHGGEDVVASTGETLTYSQKYNYSYDFEKIVPYISEFSSINKIVKLNNGLLDRMLNGKSIEEELKEKIQEARTEFCQNCSVQILKPQRNENEAEEQQIK